MSARATAAYLGQELELFAKATNWKQYIKLQTRPFLRGDVLEVGAGIGSTTRVLHAPECASWTCLEPDAQLAAELHTSVSGLRDCTNRPPTILSGEIAQLDQNARYDSILYIDVLEHIERDGEELAGAVELLRPDGHLLVLSPAHQALYSPFDKAIGHHRRYDRAMISALRPVGVDLVCVRYLDCVGIVASLGNRLITRASVPNEAQIRTWDRWMIPLSRAMDPLIGYRLGKTILAVWRREGGARLSA